MVWLEGILDYMGDVAANNQNAKTKVHCNRY